jgi:hypothetical protein
MPYKNPEDKRRWEREHRQQRNVRRRMHRSDNAIVSAIPNRAPDPGSDQEPTNGWKLLLGLALGVGGALLGALSGVRLSKIR